MTGTPQRWLWLHAGLHKTGSTYIQAMLAQEQDRLAEAGIYFRRPEGPIEGNYPEAWALQQDDLEPLLTYARKGFETGASQVVLSAEDLSSLLVRPGLGVELVQAVRRDCDASVTLAVYLRRPSAQFWSMVGQLSGHGYYDPFQLLAEALRDGFVRIAEPAPGDFFAPEWLYLLDHGRHLSRFRRRVPGAPLRVFDFDSEAYPGAGLFAALGIDPAMPAAPPPAARNAGVAAEALPAIMVEKLSDTLPDDPAAATVEAAAAARTAVPEQVRRAISAVIDARFAAGSRSLLETAAN
ncbi:MAG: hypothetical protein ACX93N_10725 [Pseudohaliea sp.]